MSALAIAGLRKAFGRARILQGVDLEIAAGEIHAVIGPNGAGKSTLFDVVSGRIAPDAGTVRLHGRDIAGLPPHMVARAGLARSFQITSLFPSLSAFETVRLGLLRRAGHGASLWRLLPRAHALNAEARALLDRLGLSDRADRPAGLLPYADQRRLEIGLTLAAGADVLLLDEPTAGMNRADAASMTDLIRAQTAGKTVVIVEHDMNVVFGLARRISVLARGQIIATGTPDTIRGNAAVQEAYLGTVPSTVPSTVPAPTTGGPPC